MKRLFLTVAVLTFCFAFSASNANAVVLDFTDPTNFESDGFISDGTTNAYFVHETDENGGTGNLDSFVMIETQIVKGDPIPTQAYNTTVNDVFDNTNVDNNNHEILLADVIIRTFLGIDYYEFLYDVNQNEQQYASIDDIQLFTSDTINQSVETCDAGGSCTGNGEIVDLVNADLIYQMDGLVDSTIILDFQEGSGSGTADMFFYVPVTAFESTTYQYVYLYSHLGNYVGTNHDVAVAFAHLPNDGFDEWGLRDCTVRGNKVDPICSGGGGENPVPEPTSMILFGTGLVGAIVRKRMLASAKP